MSSSTTNVTSIGIGTRLEKGKTLNKSAFISSGAAEPSVSQNAARWETTDRQTPTTKHVPSSTRVPN